MKFAILSRDLWRHIILMSEESLQKKVLSWKHYKSVVYDHYKSVVYKSGSTIKVLSWKHYKSVGIPPIQIIKKNYPSRF
jgi:hypothetical protein